MKLRSRLLPFTVFCLAALPSRQAAAQWGSEGVAAANIHAGGNVGVNANLGVVNPNLGSSAMADVFDSAVNAMNVRAGLTQAAFAPIQNEAAVNPAAGFTILKDSVLETVVPGALSGRALPLYWSGALRTNAAGRPSEVNFDASIFKRAPTAAELAQALRRAAQMPVDAFERLYEGGARENTLFSTDRTGRTAAVSGNDLRSYPSWLGLKAEAAPASRGGVSSEFKVQSLVSSGDGLSQGLVGRRISAAQAALIERVAVSMMSALSGGDLEKSYRTAMAEAQAINAAQYADPIPEFKRNLIDSLMAIRTNSASAQEFQSAVRELLSGAWERSQKGLYRDEVFVRAARADSARSGAEMSREQMLYPAVPSVAASPQMKAIAVNEAGRATLSPMLAVLGLIGISALMGLRISAGAQFIPAAKIY